MTYVYDTDSTCGTSRGDLVKKADPIGNVICYTYDALHRPTSAIVPSGSYASVTPKKYFLYDSATVNGITMVNVKGRVAEAYTCTSTCTSKITDTGLSYSLRGEISNQYESTPHSGGYYTTTLSHWANGLPDVLTGPGIPNITYSPDGEGRVSAVSAASGQNPVTGVSYNLYASPPQTTVTLGSGDSDVFNFDPNTGRVTQYQYNVGSHSVTGALTWHPNGTLGALAITDPLNSGNAQTCSYSHDDLARIAGANCGTPWAQTFSYDPFGNLSKSGSQSFSPVYSYSGVPNKNQYISFSGFTPTYDNNGNITADPNNTYSWDANGRPITLDGVSLTYDALGRMVEQNSGSVYDEIAYTPTGDKLALMSGSTLVKAFISLPGGGQAVYTASGLAYYRHGDWLGSSRFASTPSQTMYFDTAYAPFGEHYAQSGTTDLSFTGQDQDTASGVYDFAARELGEVSGRWSSPDPAGTAAVNPGDPQSWNR